MCGSSHPHGPHRQVSATCPALRLCCIVAHSTRHKAAFCSIHMRRSAMCVPALAGGGIAHPAAVGAHGLQPATPPPLSCKRCHHQTLRHHPATVDPRTCREYTCNARATRLAVSMSLLGQSGVTRCERHAGHARSVCDAKGFPLG